ncbi:MAG: hypothetical protein IJ304_04320 [Clostridia bacterium]|nr:hypothetical protein [Clostridia bacterium]
MEVYGEKPKKFTAKWWGYVWEYYKWHIVCVLFIIFTVVTTFQQCANRPSYDLQITAVTENALALSQTDAITALAEEVISDATGNGVNEAFILPISMNEQSDAQTIQAGYARFTVEITMPEAYVFIVSDAYADTLIESEILESTDVWAGGNADEYLVSLKDNEKLTALGIDTDGLYLGVVKLFEGHQEDEVEKTRQENGVRFGRYLLGLE